MMKTKNKIIGILILYGLLMQFQAISQTNSGNDWDNATCGETVHGIRKYIHFENCDQDIFITVTEEDLEGTQISGIIETSAKIIIKPIQGRIQIMPMELNHNHNDDQEDDHNHDDPDPEHNHLIRKAHKVTAIGDDSEDDLTRSTAETGYTKRSESLDNTLLLEKDIQPPFFKLFPNPTTDSIGYSTSETIDSYTVFNNYGINVLEGNAINHTIWVRSLPKGMYYIHLQTADKVIIKTFVKN